MISLHLKLVSGAAVKLFPASHAEYFFKEIVEAAEGQDCEMKPGLQKERLKKTARWSKVQVHQAQAQERT